MATRVLWLAKGLGPGGTERLLVQLARARDPARVQATVAFVLPWKDHLAGELEETGVETVCLSTRRGDPHWPLRLRRLVADGGFDIVHSHSPVPAVAARLAVRSLPRTRRPALVTTEHNTWTSLRTATRWASRLTARLDAATFLVAWSSAAASRMEPMCSSIAGSISARLSADPVERSSSTMTSSTPGVETRWRQTLEPMNPAPPVTSTRTAADATVAGHGDESALAGKGPRSRRHRAPPRRAGPGE